MTNSPAAPTIVKAGRPRPGLPARQQPDWRDHPDLPVVRRVLEESAPLVTAAQAAELTAALAAAANGDALALQAGDCAESLEESTAGHTDAKLAGLDRLADQLSAATGRPVVRIGRIGGQFAKPRSADVEMVGGRALPVFRGHAVNSAIPDPELRRPDPLRLLRVYEASAAVLGRLDEHRQRPGRAGSGPWASHEALLLDYEFPLLRLDKATGRSYLASTHLPWIGYRTSQLDHTHVALLVAVSNPVALKVGPSTTAGNIARLCAVLDPERRPGRLTLVVRMGHRRLSELLPPLLAAVRHGGHRPVWLSDPLHGNTIVTPDGHKTRRLTDAIAEVTAFHEALARAGQPAGGLHLEVAAGAVTECVGAGVGEDRVGDRYETLCDPRLNPTQAAELIDRTHRR